MTKRAIQCSNCGLYYDRFVYTTCPHCSEKTPIEDEPPKKEPPTPVELKETPRPDNEENTHIKTAPVKRPDVIEPDISGGSEPSSSTDKPSSLQMQIQKSGRTVGRYTPQNGANGVEPVVGWLVCVKGAHFGQSFTLKSGKNRIGRSHEMNVRLMDDDSVSRTCVAEIVFDTKACVFSILPGQSESLCYVNGNALYNRLVLLGYEEIELGDTGRNKFVFLPLCSEKFQWSTYEEATK